MLIDEENLRSGSVTHGIIYKTHQVLQCQGKGPWSGLEPLV